METSWGNGGVIHASEVEPWSQPGMPMKIIKWLGKENAPLLLRYGAIPHMLRWGLEFARNCTPERFRANSQANLHLALHSLKSLQEIGAETGIAYDRATRGVLKIYRSRESLDGAERSMRLSWRSTACCYERIDPGRCVELEPALDEHEVHPGRRRSISPATRSAIATSSPKALAAACAARGVQLPIRRDGPANRDERRPGDRRHHRQGPDRRRYRRGRHGQLHRAAARQERHPRADLSR